MRKFLGIFIVIFVLLVLYIIEQRPINSEKLAEPQRNTVSVSVQAALKPTLTLTPIVSLTPVYRSKVLIENVPFTSQAPLAEWKDPRFQDGCEEAAVLIAVFWAKGLTLDKTKAHEEILAESLYQSEKYQEFRDTSARDTANRLILGYFNFNKFEVRDDISLEDIKTEIRKGNLVIVPTNGQILNNPHFTPPGPERHNIVVRGFDDTKGEIITNDPGIKEGELYRYPEQLFYDAIRDYPTGYHQPINGINKVMIIIKKD